MNPLVSDLMETDVVTIDVNRSLEDVGTRLYEEGVGSVIVLSEEGNPMGIVTKHDVLRAIAEENPVLSEVGISEYMSRPLSMIEPDRPIRGAVRRMNEEGVEQLAIVEDYEVVGIISKKDVIQAYDSLIKAAHEAERQPRT
ncbi:MAG: CBS domain-containing protein [Halodesulfurarchaeum sp.]